MHAVQTETIRSRFIVFETFRKLQLIIWAHIPLSGDAYPFARAVLQPPHADLNKGEAAKRSAANISDILVSRGETMTARQDEMRPSRSVLPLVADEARYSGRYPKFSTNIICDQLGTIQLTMSESGRTI